ncbi:MULTISPECIES: MarR family winged helix-turn-helix transcriptional regulator [unclassified Rhizobium]|uniref:MarR family winged helix-turn-helix transcriptional regulator n=1 Tax=unclassified Rhizobium TaxID=2613769 RepID=UPI0006FDD399|nr:MULTISPECIES: MarR family winged helix-turn-helix transcriptional regulator [unclassified Rhizobium]KQV35247.1 MarR family transcriptional regulator [Rhizobium sp. Root1212]KRD25052.1 MarR family transcriptional regulator [Rhizobium sp. Root268]
MDDALPFDLMHFMPYRMAAAAQFLSDQLAQIYRVRCDLSNAEWRVMAHLAYSGNVSVRDVEARGGMEKSKVSRAAARLEDQGFIEKRVNETDRRLVQLTLTEKGRSLMAELLPLAAAFQADVERRLGPTFVGLEAALDRLLGEKA